MTKSADMATLLDSNSKVPGADIAGTSLPVASINATGTPSASTFLRGDGSWQAAGGGQTQSQLFTASSSWTAPTGVTRVRATVVGGGGGARVSSPGGWGGLAIGEYTVTPGTSYTITVGTGGTGSNTTATAGSTSSFASFCSATGGAGGAGTAGASGTGSSGTLRNNAVYVNYSLLGPPLSGQMYKDTDTNLNPVAFNINNRWGAGARGSFDGCGANFSNGGVGGAVFIEWVG